MAQHTGGRKIRGLSFSQTSLKTAINHLIENCYFIVGNVTMKQATGIQMGIDPVPFWANFFLYSYEEGFISSLISSVKIKARHFCPFLTNGRDNPHKLHFKIFTETRSIL